MGVHSFATLTVSENEGELIEPQGDELVANDNGPHVRESNGIAGLSRDLGLHYTGLERPYEVGHFGVESSAAFLRRIEFVHRRLVFLEAFHVVARSLWEL